MITAFDTETFPIAPGRQAPRLVCLSTSDGVLVNAADAEGIIRSLLRSATILVGHNVAFDFAVIGAAFPRLLPSIFRAYDQDRVHDTGIRQKLIDIAEGVYRGFVHGDGSKEKVGYSLADLAKRHLKVRLDKDTWRMGYASLAHTPIAQWPEGARLYALDDARHTAHVWRAQQERSRYLDDQCRQARAAFWLRLTSTWGIHTDARAVGELAHATKTEHARLSQMLTAAGLKRPDRRLKSGPRKGQIIEGARDTKAAAERMIKAFAALGKPHPETETGRPKLDEATCIASKDHTLLVYADLSSITKVLSTDIPMLEAGTLVPIHTRFEELLETGRTSSSKPNIQNIRRLPGVRECFIPRPRWVFASADYLGLELRTVAQVLTAWFGSSRLADVLNAGGDPHLQMAATILGCTYDEAQRRKSTGDEEVDTARQVGKVANFGFPGGLGIAKMMDFAASGYGVILTEEKAKTLKEQWLSAWPEFQRYFAKIGAMVDVPYPQIEQLYSHRFRGGVSYTEACNSFFQGLGADAAKAAGWLIAKACYVDRTSVLYGCRIVNFVHDEFILEVPESIGHEAAHELARLMCLGASTWLPDVAPQAEPLLMKRWSKKAKPTWAEGKLIAWDA